MNWPPDDNDIQTALLAALCDGSWGTYDGPNCPALAAALSDYHSLDHVLLCSSGTIAVELALRGVGVKAGDEVVLAGYDFPGNFRAIEVLGARPVLVDIDPHNWCLSFDQLAELKRTNCEHVKAVIVSHLHGGLAPMRQIVELARESGWAVVEDACQAPGAKIEGQIAGTWGDVGVLSFGGSKLLTAGRGGAIISGDESIVQRARIYSDRGNQAFPLSELQAAVLVPQLALLDERNKLRRNRADLFLSEASATKEELVPLRNIIAGDPAYYKLAWRYAPDQPDAPNRDQLIVTMHADAIPIDAGFRGFTGRTKRRCRKLGDLTASKLAAEQTILLHHPLLLESEAIIKSVARKLARCVGSHRADIR